MSANNRRGTTTSIITAGVLLAGAAGAIWMVTSDRGESVDLAAKTFTVRTGDFDVSIPTSGELVATEMTIIRNELDTRATITWIRDEGEYVQAGDLLFRFDDEDLRNKVVDAEDAVDKASNELETARADLEIAENSRESDLAEADLRIRVAQLDYDGWLEGEDKVRTNELESELKTQEMDTTRLREQYDHSQRLYKDDFISIDDLTRDKIAWKRAEASLESARINLEKYKKYDRIQELEKKESELQQAKDERERTDHKTKAEVEGKISDLLTAERKLGRETEELEKYRNQRGLCEVAAPNEGLVIYAASLNQDHWRREEPPEIGTELKPKKEVIILPNTRQMLASVKVNEGISRQIRKGFPALIVPDGFPDEELAGRIQSVGVLAEAGEMGSERRDYRVDILIDGGNEIGLKPGMRCSARILVGEVSNALHVPIGALFQEGGVSYVWTPDGDGYSQTRVEIGRSSERFVEILSGIKAGDTVLLSKPAAEQIVSTLGIEQVEVGTWVGERPENAEAPTTAGLSGERPAEGERASDAAQQQRGGQAGGGQGWGGMGNMSEEQQAEMRKRREEAMKKYDTDGDGEISEEERAEMMKDFQNRGGGGGTP